MQLTQESYRTRWLVLVVAWTFAAALLWAQARLVDEYLNIAGQVGLRGAPVASTPLKQIYPAFAADAQMWVQHAISLQEGNGPRLRFTTIDNAPHGREVHWNSAWAWWVAAGGWVQHLFTGQPLATATERATLWLNPLTMFGFVVFFSAWTTRKAGLAAGVVVVLAMIGHDRFLEGFFPSYVDHHGLLTLSVFGLVLGAVFMGGGWWQEPPAGSARILPPSPDAARNAAVFSAFSGACGLWVSAASVIPAIAIVGLSGLVAVLFQGKLARQGGATFDPGTWQLWGRVGAILSLFFYLLEYFPNHLGFRLEANHPLHALAWFGGGELIAAIGKRWLGRPEDRWANPLQLGLLVGAICLAPAAIAIGGAKVFIVFDPFMSHLHNDYIQEFLPMWRTLQTFDKKGIFHVLVIGSLPLIAAIGMLTYRGRENSIVLWFATFVAGLLTAMAWWQSRWLLNVTGSLVCLLLVLFACWTAKHRPWVRWLVAMGVTGAFFIPSIASRYLGSSADVRARRVSPKDANGALNRDIATALRRTQPTGDIVLVTSPNASVSIGYFGRIKTLGTLYWENSAGLKAAAAILGARSEEEAAALIRTHKVTHIAIIADENFIQPYFRLLHLQASPEEMRKSFGNRLMLDRIIPQWLQMIPYAVPDDLKGLNAKVMLFKVNFNQTLPEAIYNAAETLISQGLLQEADNALDLLLKQEPQISQPWLRKGELAVSRHDWEQAAEYLLKGIGLAPIAERATLYASGAQVFYNERQHGLAIRFYRTALAEKPTANLACYLAWVLATSPIDALRNGPEALQLAEEALKTDPNSPTYLNAKAAALAELGRLPEAIAFGDRAVANARVRGEGAAERVFAERLAILKAGKPLRN